MPERKIAAPFYEKLSLVLLGLIALGYLVILGKDLIDPIVFGFLYSILLLPIAEFLEKRLRFPRTISSVCSIILLISFIGTILYFVGAQISRLTDDWPMLKSQVNQSLRDLSQWIQSAFHINASSQLKYVDDTAKKIEASGTSVIGATFGAVSSVMVFNVFSLIFTFFMLLYRSLLIRFIVWVFSDEHSAIVHDIVENVQKILRQYILGLLLEMLVVASLACTVFWIIGVKYAVLMGILIGLFNLIPYLGIFTALFLSSVITFATGSIQNTILVAFTVLIIHEIDTNFLLPTIVGSKVKLNALVTFIGVILGEMIWGLSGMFLSIPILAIMKIIFDRVDSLKPWGYLLGGGEKKTKAKTKRMTPREVDQA
ncbi:MAG TPA: AI-2E family transporter [Mucilaginibacter sp.]|jgi:predicted PurR-regulated permease PerM